MTIQVLLPLCLALLAAPLVAVVGLYRPAWAPPAGVALAILAVVSAAWGWWSGGGTVDLAWAPTWNLRLAFTLDGLAALYALLATGIGSLVLIYSTRYLPAHLAQEERPAADQVRFYGLMLLFMGAMVGLVMAQDLLLLFVFWDLTAITSYYLIGYDRAKAEARDAALMALLVTGIASILFLIGALLLYTRYQTFSLPALASQVQPDWRLSVAAGLMAVAALAKSAQVPFHFWLPRAMTAPTPVSAYLHSAAMVAAGVFLLERLYPFFRASPLVHNGILAVGVLSILSGGIMALTEDRLKRVLAYSTVAQYGYVVVMLGWGGRSGVVGASFYVLAHALIKSALFLTAGAVTEATGEERLSRVGGLGRTMPLLAAASGVAAAGLAGLPLTLGFFKDDLFFKASFEAGWPWPLVAGIGAALTVAYIWRFWGGIFLGRLRSPGQPVPAALTVPVAILGLLVLVGWIAPAPFAGLAEAAGAVSWEAPTPVELAYHLAFRPETGLVLAVYGLGLLLIISGSLWQRAAALVARIGAEIGPERWYRAALDGLTSLAGRIYNQEERSLARRITTILLPAAILVSAGLLVTPRQDVYRIQAIQIADLPLVLALALAGIAALIVPVARGHFNQVLALAAVDFSLATVFALFGGANVAFVAVLVGAVSSLFLLGGLTLFPPEALARQTERTTPQRREKYHVLVGLIAGLFAFVVAWITLGAVGIKDNVAIKQIQLAPSAHANDVVTAILADFRGLDTVGEITVIAVAFMGIATLLRWRRA